MYIIAESNTYNILSVCNTLNEVLHNLLYIKYNYDAFPGQCEIFIHDQPGLVSLDFLNTLLVLDPKLISNKLKDSEEFVN